jgi:cell wall-associated NlpC family hydrolase
MKLHTTIIALFLAGCLIYVIIIVDIIRNSSVWRAISATYGRNPKDGFYGARWIIWGMILTLTLSLSPSQARGVFPKSVSRPNYVTPMQDLAATFQVTPTEAAYSQSSAIPGTESLKKMPILNRGYSLKPLTHSKPVISPPHSQVQSQKSAPLLGRSHVQLNLNDLSERLVAQARHYLNTPYKRGGSLERGNATDCSGFVQYIYESCDIKLPRSSSEQAHEGKVVARTMDFAKMIPGDLLFFRLGRRRVGHVGIYLGEGKMIHAADRRHGVVVSDLSQPYYRGKFVVAKRILTERQYQ